MGLDKQRQGCQPGPSPPTRSLSTLVPAPAVPLAPRVALPTDRHVTMDTKGGTDRAPGSGAHPTQVPVRNQAALQSPEHPATRMGAGHGEKTDRGSPRAGWAQSEVLGLSHKMNPCSFPLPAPEGQQLRHREEVD